jgi:hypothetical protein
MQDRHAEEAHGGAGGAAGLTKEIIFGRIAAYEIAFGNRPNGRSSPTFIGYFSRDEIVLMGFMGLNEVTDPARLMAYHKMEADRQGTDWFGPNTPRFAALGEKLPLFGYGFLAYGDGWVQSEDVSPLAIQSAVSKMRDSATGRAAIRAYDLEIVKVLKDRFLIHDFAQIMTVYGSVEFVPEEGAELSTDDMALQFVGKVIKATGLVDISKLTDESKEKIVEVLNKKIAEKNVALAGHMVDQTEKKLPVCSVERWAEVLMRKVSEAAAVGDVFSAQAVRTAQAENQRLRQQLSQMEARLTAQQVPATPRFHGVCDNCKVYGHQARECTATRRPEGSSKGSAHLNGGPGGRGGQQGVQPGGKGGGGKGDAGGRGRGRAVAAVNQAAPGSQPFVMTDAQFNRWMTAQGK